MYVDLLALIIIVTYDIILRKKYNTHKKYIVWLPIINLSYAHHLRPRHCPHCLYLCRALVLLSVLLISPVLGLVSPVLVGPALVVISIALVSFMSRA